MNNATLRRIVDAIGAQEHGMAHYLIDMALEDETGVHWQRDLKKLQATLIDFKPRFTILAKGNGKLPFLPFSVLPGVTCPGAGECLDFCYSYKAWRYPAAFCRQAQNTILMQANPKAVIEAFDKPKQAAAALGKRVDFRLYVDGDFSSPGDVKFWFDFLQSNSWLNAYGYSKSFNELLTYTNHFGEAALPDNYTLNLSSGHMHDSQVVHAMAQLPITRGDFVAVAVPTNWKQSDYGSSEYNKELRSTHKAATGRKAFPCPGKCGECRIVGGTNVHACGDASLANLDIIIAVH